MTEKLQKRKERASENLTQALIHLRVGMQHLDAAYLEFKELPQGPKVRDTKRRIKELSEQINNRTGSILRLWGYKDLQGFDEFHLDNLS